MDALVMQHYYALYKCQCYQGEAYCLLAFALCCSASAEIKIRLSRGSCFLGYIDTFRPRVALTPTYVILLKIFTLKNLNSRIQGDYVSKVDGINHFLID